MALEYFALPHRPPHHAAVAARRLREERSVAADAEHRVARAAALARQVRRPAAPLPGDHAGGVQPAPHLARLGAHQVAAIRSTHPEIKLNYLRTEEDRKVAVDGMRFTRRIMAAKALAKYAPEEYRPGIAVRNDAELEKAAGELGTTIFHPVGTCRMGSDALAVVDDELRVRGVRGLRVIDASVMPRITSGQHQRPDLRHCREGRARHLWKPYHPV